jgi:hypothetical protein
VVIDFDVWSITNQVQLLGYLFNWALFGVLSVQVCKLIHFSCKKPASARGHRRLLPGFQSQRFSKHQDPRYGWSQRYVHLTWLILSVYGLYLVEVVQVILATHDAFNIYGAGWGNIAALNNLQWSWFDTPIMSGIGKHLWCIIAIHSERSLVSAIVQCFYGWRIYTLSKSKTLGLFVTVVRNFTLLFQRSQGYLCRSSLP